MVVISLLALVSLFLFFPRTALIRSVLTRIESGYSVRIAYTSFVFDLRHGTAVRGIEIVRRDGVTIASARRLSAGIHWPSLLRGHITVSDIVIDGLSADARALLALMDRGGPATNSAFSIDALTLSDAHIRLGDIFVRGNMRYRAGRVSAEGTVNDITAFNADIAGDSGEISCSRIDWRTLMPKNQFTALIGIDAAVPSFNRSGLTLRCTIESNAVGFATKHPFVLCTIAGKRTMLELSGEYRSDTGDLSIRSRNALLAGTPVDVSFIMTKTAFRVPFTVNDVLPIAIPSLGVSLTARGTGEYGVRGLTATIALASLWYTNALLRHPFFIPKASVVIDRDTIRALETSGRYGTAAFTVRIPAMPLSFTNLRASLAVAAFDIGDIVPASGGGANMMPISLAVSVKRLSLASTVFEDVHAVLESTPSAFAVSSIRAVLGLGTVNGEYRIRFTENPARHIASFSAEGVHVNRVVKDITGEEYLYGTAEASADADFTLGSVADVWTNGFFSLTATVKAGRIKRGVYLDAIYGKLGRESPAYEYFDDLTLSGGLNSGKVIAERIVIRGEDKEYHLSGGAYDLAKKELSIRSNELYVSESFRDRYIPNPLYLAGLFRASRPGWFIVGPFSYDKGTVEWGKPEHSPMH